MKKAFSFLVIAVLCLAIILPASADTLHLYRIAYDGVETFQADKYHKMVCCRHAELYARGGKTSSVILNIRIDGINLSRYFDRNNVASRSDRNSA